MSNKELRWTAIYGAMIAAQYQERMSRGKGPPDEEQMDGIMEEAAAVADYEDERRWEQAKERMRELDPVGDDERAADAALDREKEGG